MTTEHERSATGRDEPTTELTDALAAVMADGRRRRVLSVMASDGGRGTLDRLAAVVASTSTDARRGRIEGGSDDSVAVVLHHCHLPKLADVGLVEYDRESREATLTAKGDRCASRIDRLRSA